MKKILSLLLPLLLLIGCSSSDDNYRSEAPTTDPKVFIAKHIFDTEQVSPSNFKTVIKFTVKNDYTPRPLIHYYVQVDIKNHGVYKSDRFVVLPKDSATSTVVIESKTPIKESDIKNSSVIVYKYNWEYDPDDPIFVEP